MSQAAVFFGTGYEEIEALTVVDILRRAGVDTTMVSVSEERKVTGSHAITVEMDAVIAEVDFESLDMIVLPGGMPGTANLEACEALMEQVDAFASQDRIVAAICAAPSILGHRGILKGRKACCYPSWESHLEGAVVTKGPVEISDHVVTSRGMGTAIDFALSIAGIFCGSETAEEMAQSILYGKAE